MNLREAVLSGMMGLTIGDALGVPVEFKPRESLIEDPVVGMREHGTYDQPMGTWSDDSSMALCSMVSLTKNGLDTCDMRKRFEDWYYNAYMTPHGHTFDCGNTVSYAIEGKKGCDDVYDNGNGSLMRILPVAYYLYVHKELDLYSTVRAVSSITHAHDRSVLACAIYVSIAIGILNGETLKCSLSKTLDTFKGYPESCHYQRLYGIESLKESDIDSSGYVVSTLEASLWCLLNSNSYRESVLKAVNLGHDTDTTGAVTGGLAGLMYGYDSIPTDWLRVLVKRSLLEDVCIEYAVSLEN
jgi:ADP-ribosylglycohydrolase